MGEPCSLYWQILSCGLTVLGWAAREVPCVATIVSSPHCDAIGVSYWAIGFINGSVSQDEGKALCGSSCMADADAWVA